MNQKKNKALSQQKERSNKHQRENKTENPTPPKLEKINEPKSRCFEKRICVDKALACLIKEKRRPK